jgi:uncharacterized spore protein YtfJ
MGRREDWAGSSSENIASAHPDHLSKERDSGSELQGGRGEVEKTFFIFAASLLKGGKKMEELNSILRTITAEMQKSLSAKTVIGEPITMEGKTVVPLVSVGMGFGAGAGFAKDQSTPGGGGGGGMGMKPVAVIIIDEHGVRVDSLKPTKLSLLEQLAEVVVPRLAEGEAARSQRSVPIEASRES